MTARSVLKAACACGQVELEARGRPIVAVVCYCDDCQEAGRRIEALPAASRVLEPDGGTSLVVYRKDRLRCVRGQERLTPHKLKPDSATSRYVASCCNSALYLGFDDAKHWVDVFTGRIEGAAPPVQMRLCTRFRPAGADLPDDAPGYPGFPFALISRFVRAKLAMTFGR
jgi:hypothetical protein